MVGLCSVFVQIFGSKIQDFSRLFSKTIILFSTSLSISRFWGKGGKMEAKKGES